MKDPDGELQIDLALSVLCAITPRDVCWTMRDMAEICGCTLSKIETIQRRATNKFRRAAKARHMQDYLQD